MEKIRTYLKSVPITFETWIISFFGVVLIRIFFEQYSSFHPKRFVLLDPPTIIHYSIWFLAEVVTIMVIILLFTKISMREVLAISIFGLIGTWIGPIGDLVTGGVGGNFVSYVWVSGHELLIRFLSFFGGGSVSDITTGLRTGVIFLIIACCAYIYSVTKNALKTVGAGLAIYCVVFILSSIPSFIVLLTDQGEPFSSIQQSIVSSHVIENNIHPAFMTEGLGLTDSGFVLGFNKTMTGTNTLIALLMSVLFFFITARRKILALIKNNRPGTFHFFLLFTFGASLSYTKWFINWIDVQSYVLGLVAFTCAWMFSVCQNDIQDEKIDIISNKDRPLISKELTKSDMETASKIFLFFAIVSAYASSYYVLFFTCFFTFLYYIYSNPPLSLKRFVVLSSFIISLADLSVVLAGFFLINKDKTIVAFPFSLVVGIIILFTAASNVRDIKDFEGDRANGIKTLPVLLGLKNSKRLIAGIICFFYLLTPWYFHISLLIVPSVVASALSWYFINKKNYKEWQGYLVYMLYLILIIGVFVLM